MNPHGFEKRRHRRYPMPDGIIVNLKPHTEILGQLLDLGRGGLAFRYIDMWADLPETDCELVILQPRPRIYLEGIRFRTVSDVAVPSPFSFSSLSIRRRGVAFETLSDRQHRQLERLIRIHTPLPSFHSTAQPPRMSMPPT